MFDINLFGTTTVHTDGASFTARDLGGAKPRQILEILAVHGGTPVAKERLAEKLWDGEPPRSYLGTLESYVCLLRRRLDLGMGRSSLLATTPEGYVLDTSIIRVDLLVLKELARDSTGLDAREHVRRGLEAMVLVSGELLASSPYASWADQVRAELLHDLTVLCLRAADAALHLGDWAAAVALTDFLLRHDQLSEPAADRLMQALGALGRRPEAMRVYLDLRTALADELGLEPCGQLKSRYVALLAAEAPAKGPGWERDELKVLLRALRSTLERFPGVKVPVDDGALAALAVRVIAAA